MNTKGVSTDGVWLSSWRAPTLSCTAGFWTARKLEYHRVQPVRIKTAHLRNHFCGTDPNIGYNVCEVSTQSYLSPETGSDEGSSAAGASPAAHGVSDRLLVLFGCQDSMQRCLERTWQTYKENQHHRWTRHKWQLFDLQLALIFAY